MLVKRDQLGFQKTSMRDIVKLIKSQKWRYISDQKDKMVGWMLHNEQQSRQEKIRSKRLIQLELSWKALRSFNQASGLTVTAVEKDSNNNNDIEIDK